ncbi:uncharacterized protein V5649_009990 isoform 1-T1 [Rhynchonycteris naso]
MGLGERRPGRGRTRPRREGEHLAEVQPPPRRSARTQSSGPCAGWRARPGQGSSFFTVDRFRPLGEPILENNLTSLIEHLHNALEHVRRLRFNNDKMKTITK